MIAALPYPLVLTLVGLAGLALHETTHYLAARAAGSPARFSHTQGWLLPDPAVRVDPLALSPAAYAAVCLAPVVVALPSALAFAAAPPTGDAIGLALMWLLTTLPSPPDWRQAYNAADVRTLHAATEGPHPAHQAAEGIA